MTFTSTGPGRLVVTFDDSGFSAQNVMPGDWPGVWLMFYAYVVWELAPAVWPLLMWGALSFVIYRDRVRDWMAAAELEDLGDDPSVSPGPQTGRPVRQPAPETRTTTRGEPHA